METSHCDTAYGIIRTYQIIPLINYKKVFIKFFLCLFFFSTPPTGLGLRENIFFYHILSLQRGLLVSTDRVHLPPLPSFPPLPLLLGLHFSRQLATVNSFYFGQSGKDHFWLKGTFEKDANVMGQDDPASRSHYYMPCEHNGD